MVTSALPNEGKTLMSVNLAYAMSQIDGNKVLLVDADLRRLVQEHPWLSVTLAVSDDKLSALEHGDIGEIVARHGPWRSRDVYIAGPGAMVEDTESRLIASGVAREHIRSEVFAPSRPGPSLDGEVTE